MTQALAKDGALFRRLALATAVSTYLLVVLGGAVKAYGAGLACPDWPLCYGQVIPQFDMLILLEWGHRLGALLVSLLAAWATLVGWRALREDRRVRTLLLWAALLLFVQVGLGGVTVLLKNAAFATSAHLGTAMAYLAVWLAVGMLGGAPVAGGVSPSMGRFRRLIIVTILAVWSVMVLGSYLKSAGGGLACPDWPLCGGRVIPAFDHPLVALHWAHRVGALLAGGLVTAVAVGAFRTKVPHVAAGGTAVGAMYAAQVAMGALSVLSLLSPPVITAHLSVGAALFGTLVVTGALTYWSGHAARQPGGPARTGTETEAPSG